MSTCEDPWSKLQSEIPKALHAYSGRDTGKIFVSTLLPFSTHVVFEQTGTVLHLRRKRLSSDSFQSEIDVTSNKRIGNLIVCADPDRGFILDSGQALTIHEFCVWLFDLACQLPESTSP